MDFKLQFLLLTFLYSLQMIRGKHVSTELAKRDLCPLRSALTCLNALFLYPCQTDEDCSRRTSMVCCPTNCPNYSKTLMCVSRVTDYCPFQTPYHIDQKECRSRKDCGKDMICCKDVLGRGFCSRT